MLDLVPVTTNAFGMRAYPAANSAGCLFAMVSHKANAVIHAGRGIEPRADLAVGSVARHTPDGAAVFTSLPVIDR